MNGRRTRVIADPLQGGRWQAQYWDPVARVWFDIGDAETNREAADRKAREGKQA